MNIPLLGALKAGKTSLLYRLRYDEFVDHVDETMIVPFELEKKSFYFLDAPQLINDSLAFYPENQKFFVACIDLTKPSKQEEAFVLELLSRIKTKCHSVEVILVGTKLDASTKDDSSKSLNIIKGNLENKGIKIHSAHLTSAKTGQGLDALKASLIEINQEDNLLNVRIPQQPHEPSRARLFHDHPIATGAALGACLVATLMLTAVLSLSLPGFAIGCVIIILGGLVGAISTDSPKPNFA